MWSIGLDHVLVAVGFVLVAIQVWVARKQVELGRTQSTLAGKQAAISADLLEIERRRDKAVLKVSWAKGITENRILGIQMQNLGGRAGRLEYIMANWDSIREDADWRPPGTNVPMHLGGISLFPVGYDPETKQWRDVPPPLIPPGEEVTVNVALGGGAPGNLGTKGFPEWPEPHLMELKPHPVVGEGETMSMKVWWPRHDKWVRENNQKVVEQQKAKDAAAKD